ncbi:MAG TPA: hypothetical protein VMC84_09555 [Methanocella sp.]|uniref:hypothetical protein n=1 Tax=Methanocella sp. TaxID=2052833 RepID=UPI002BD6296E|nr:hypothetical protein [Methanocella sp.]HTY91409.1 hypothetical protein [Methanocella sp.]
MDRMSRIDKFLYIGEKAIFSLNKESPLGSEYLVATDRRIVHIKGERFYDIKYESLESLGCYTIYDWKWLLIGVIAAVTAALMSATIRIPLYFMANVNLDYLAQMMTFTMSLLLAFAGALLLAFVMTIRRGIILKTPFETRVFNYPRSMQKEAFDFVKIVRAAEVGILKPHKSIKPEIIEPRQRSLDAIKPLPPRPQPNEKMPRL